jgi:hypothetical protein
MLSISLQHCSFYTDFISDLMDTKPSKFMNPELFYCIPQQVRVRRVEVKGRLRTVAKRA